MEEPGLRVIREVKSFKSRDDTLLGFPRIPGLIIVTVGVLLFTYYELWLGAVAWVGFLAFTGKTLAKKDPYWLENFLQYVRQPFSLNP